MFWDIQTGGIIKTFRSDTHWPYSASISPDSIIVASGFHNNASHLWNIRTGECHHIVERYFTGQEGRVMTCVNFETTSSRQYLTLVSSNNSTSTAPKLDFQPPATVSPSQTVAASSRVKEGPPWSETLVLEQSLPSFLPSFVVWIATASPPVADSGSVFLKGLPTFGTSPTWPPVLLRPSLSTTAISPPSYFPPHFSIQRQIGQILAGRWLFPERSHDEDEVHSTHFDRGHIHSNTGRGAYHHHYRLEWSGWALGPPDRSSQSLLPSIRSRRRLCDRCTGG